MQQVAPVFCRVVADFQLSGIDIKRCSGVEFALDFRVECCRVLVRVRAVTFGEVSFALPTVLVPPPDLPAVAITVTDGRVKPGPAFAVLVAWLVTWCWMGLVPPVVDAHAALPCSCWERNQEMTSAGS